MKDISKWHFQWVRLGVGLHNVACDWLIEKNNGSKIQLRLLKLLLSAVNYIILKYFDTNSTSRFKIIKFIKYTLCTILLN